MAANAQQPIRIADVARAAGCSARALQQNFRSFRGTSPKAALVATRLDRARDAVARGEEPILAIARQFGFSNSSRFKAAYQRRFGETPAMTRRSL